MPVQFERDSKNSLRFFATVAEWEVKPVSLSAAKARISDIEKLLKHVKNEMAIEAGKAIINAQLRPYLPTASQGDVKPHVLKRPKSGAVPGHNRVGLQVTFSDTLQAGVFARKFNVS